jgi:hypothetical protein
MLAALGPDSRTTAGSGLAAAGGVVATSGLPGVAALVVASGFTAEYTDCPLTRVSYNC